MFLKNSLFISSGNPWHFYQINIFEVIYIIIRINDDNVINVLISEVSNTEGNRYHDVKHMFTVHMPLVK